MFAATRNGIAFMTCWHFGRSFVWRDVEMQQWHGLTARAPYEMPAVVTIGDAGLAPNRDRSTLRFWRKVATLRLRGNGNG